MVDAGCVCSVLLRQNPHNVHEWHKRVQLYEGKPTQVRAEVCAVGAYTSDTLCSVSGGFEKIRHPLSGGSKSGKTVGKLFTGAVTSSVAGVSSGVTCLDH